MSENRDRGILTPADRAYLRGEADLGSVQSERNARARIRGRVSEALLDCELLAEQLDDRDRELVFGKTIDEAGAEGFDALVGAVAFLYDGVDRTDLDFETVLREGINRAEAADDRAASVDLSVTHHALDADQLRAKLEAGEALSLTEIAHLYESDAVGREELAEYLERDRGDGIDDGLVQSRVTDY